MIIHWLAIVGTDHWELICHQWSRIRRDIASLIARGTFVFVFVWCIFALLIARGTSVLISSYCCLSIYVCGVTEAHRCFTYLVLFVNTHVCVTMSPWWVVFVFQLCHFSVNHGQLICHSVIAHQLTSRITDCQRHIPAHTFCWLSIYMTVPLWWVAC